jgi:hypothetical protein
MLSSVDWGGARKFTYELIFETLRITLTASVVLWSDFLATDPEVPG